MSRGNPNASLASPSSLINNLRRVRTSLNTKEYSFYRLVSSISSISSEGFRMVLSARPKHRIAAKTNSTHDDFLIKYRDAETKPLINDTRESSW